MKKPTINAETAEAAEKSRELLGVLGVLGGSFSGAALQSCRDHANLQACTTP